jgi:hypothetical protein
MALGFRMLNSKKADRSMSLIRLQLAQQQQVQEGMNNREYEKKEKVFDKEDKEENKGNDLHRSVDKNFKTQGPI